MSQDFEISEKQLLNLEQQFGKEFYLYSENSILEKLGQTENHLRKHNPLIFVNVSYAPNPYLIKTVKAGKSFGAACFSMHELLIAEKSGFRELDVMYTYEGFDDNALLYANLRGFRLCVNSYENLLKAEQILSQLPYSVSLSQMQDAELKKCFLYCTEKGVENIYINAENSSEAGAGRAVSRLAMCKKLTLPFEAGTSGAFVELSAASRIANATGTEFLQQNSGVTVITGQEIFVPYCHNVPDFSGLNAHNSGMFRHTELLQKQDGSVVKIRRAETMDEYFSGIDFASLGSSCNH